jgi:hypothetical protein
VVRYLRDSIRLGSVTCSCLIEPQQAYDHVGEELLLDPQIEGPPAAGVDEPLLLQEQQVSGPRVTRALPFVEAACPLGEPREPEAFGPVRFSPSRPLPWRRIGRIRDVGMVAWCRHRSVLRVVGPPLVRLEDG